MLYESTAAAMYTVYAGSVRRQWLRRNSTTLRGHAIGDFTTGTNCSVSTGRKLDIRHSVTSAGCHWSLVTGHCTMRVRR